MRITIQNCKNKHLSAFERGEIAALHKAGHSNREIGRRLGRVHGTIVNELERGTPTQLKTGRKPYTAYFPETGQAVYEKNRQNDGAKSKLLVTMAFVSFTCKMILDKDWSADSVVRFAKQHTDSKDKPIVSTKTLYNHIVQSKLSVRNIDLPMKTKLNTKTKRARKHHLVLGASIDEHPAEVEDRMAFGHWEIDTIEGKKSDDNALRTLVKHKMRNDYAFKIGDQDHDSFDDAIDKLQHSFGPLFPHVFKTITSDNGSEFSNLSACLESVTKVYFAQPYASYERGSNEIHNGLLRRYIPKGKAISDYAKEAIKRIYQTLNDLPRKILNDQQPAVAFEQELAALA